MLNISIVIIYILLFMISVSVAAESESKAELSVPNIIALKELVAQDGTVVYVEGYRMPGDGGHGYFVFDVDSDEAPDDGMVILPSNKSIKGRWLRIISEPIIDIRWYGAQSGIEDSQSRYLNAAIDYLFSREIEGTVFIPKGVYYIDSELVFTEGVSLKGEGMDKSILRNTAGHIDRMITSTRHYTPGSVLNMSYSDFTLDVNMYNLDKMIDGIWIDHMFRGLTIERFRMTNFGSNVIRSMKDSVIKDSVFDNMEGRMLSTGGDSKFSDNKIINNVFIRTSEAPTGPGINLGSADRNMVIGNKVININPPADSYGGIRIPNDSNHNLVKDNIVMNFPRGIWILSGSSNNTVANNTIIDSWIAPIFINRSHEGVPPVEYNHVLNNVIIQQNPALPITDLIRIHGDNDPDIVRHNTIEGNEIIVSRAYRDAFLRGKPINQIFDGLVWLSGSAETPGLHEVKDNYVSIIDNPFYITVDNLKQYTIYGEAFLPQVSVIDTDGNIVEDAIVSMELNGEEYQGEVISKSGRYELIITAEWQGNSITTFYFFRLTGTESISGKVVDQDGNPISGVLLDICGEFTNKIVEVDSEGFWEIEAIGKVIVTPHHPNYRFYPESKTIDGHRIDVDFVGEKFTSYSIAGTVVDDAGNPILGTIIKVSGDTVKECVVDETGSFKASNIVGDNLVIPVKEGFYFSPQRLSISENSSQLEEMNIIGVMDRALIAHYSFDEIDRRIVPDNSIFNHDAQITGVNNKTDGVHQSEAITFTGFFNFMTLPENIMYGIGDFTIAFWVKMDSYNDDARIFDFGDISNSSIWLAANSDKTILQVLGDRDNTNEWLIVSGDERIHANGEWHHVAVTRRGASAALYVNGKKIGFDDNRSEVPREKFGFTGRNYIARSNFAESHNDPFFAGSIDDFRIYNYALDEDEVLALYGIE
jgi:3-dehydroshikimate dehydratase